MSEYVYLDHAATSPLLPSVREKMLEVMNLSLGNASSLHGAGHQASTIVEEARAQVARLIGAGPEEIIFTSGGSESNNTVMETFRGQKVAVSAVEHPSVLGAARARAGKLITIPVDEFGRVKLEDLPKDVNLTSVMLANNELGTIEPVSEIAKCCKNYNTRNCNTRNYNTQARNEQESGAKDHNIFVHSDATQALGKIRIDVKELGVDYLTISAHKIGGPIGIGALYVRKGAPYESLIKGGHQENGRRAGTTNTLAIAGFGAAAEWCWENWSCKKYEKVAKLRDELRERILRGVPYSSCNSPLEGCLPNILNMSFQAAEGESIQLYLDAEGIIVGTGSACAAGDLSPSHVIMAAKHDAEVAHSSIRFSLGLDTTEQDIDRVMNVLPEIIKRLQGISTVKIGAKHD